MPSTKKYNLVAKVGEYEKNGVIKARWFTCGAVFENENGQLSVKIDSMPVGEKWDGWLNLFETNKHPIEEKTEEDSDNLPF